MAVTQCLEDHPALDVGKRFTDEHPRSNIVRLRSGSARLRGKVANHVIDKTFVAGGDDNQTGVDGLLAKDEVSSLAVDRHDGTATDQQSRLFGFPNQCEFRSLATNGVVFEQGLELRKKMGEADMLK